MLARSVVHSRIGGIRCDGGRVSEEEERRERRERTKVLIRGILLRRQVARQLGYLVLIQLPFHLAHWRDPTEIPRKKKAMGDVSFPTRGNEETPRKKRKKLKKLGTDHGEIEITGKHR